MYPMLTKLTYFGPEHFPPTQDSETLHGLSFGQYKMVPEKKNHISSLRTHCLKNGILKSFYPFLMHNLFYLSATAFFKYLKTNITNTDEFETHTLSTFIPPLGPKQNQWSGLHCALPWQRCIGLKYSSTVPQSIWATPSTQRFYTKI